MSDQGSITNLECVRCGARDNLIAMDYYKLTKRHKGFKLIAFELPVCGKCNQLFEKYKKRENFLSMLLLVSVLIFLVFFPLLAAWIPIFYSIYNEMFYYIYTGILILSLTTFLKRKDNPSRYMKLKHTHERKIRTNRTKVWVPFEDWRDQIFKEREKNDESLYFPNIAK